MAGTSVGALERHGGLCVAFAGAERANGQTRAAGSRAEADRAPERTQEAAEREGGGCGRRRRGGGLRGLLGRRWLARRDGRKDGARGDLGWMGVRGASVSPRRAVARRAIRDGRPYLGRRRRAEDVLLRQRPLHFLRALARFGAQRPPGRHARVRERRHRLARARRSLRRGPLLDRARLRGPRRCRRRRVSERHPRRPAAAPTRAPTRRRLGSGHDEGDSWNENRMNEKVRAVRRLGQPSKGVPGQQTSRKTNPPLEMIITRAPLPVASLAPTRPPGAPPLNMTWRPDGGEGAAPGVAIFASVSVTSGGCLRWLVQGQPSCAEDGRAHRGGGGHGHARRAGRPPSRGRRRRARAAWSSGRR